MLYIEKLPVPSKIQQQLVAMKSSQEWKSISSDNTDALRYMFDSLPKRDICDLLLTEQHYLCAYCMKRIENHSLHMSIEHFIPLSKSKETALEYSNFLGVCKGGADVSLDKGSSSDKSKPARKRILCCDASKGDELQLLINPLNADMMSHIAYTKNGKIYCVPKDWSSEQTELVKYEIDYTLCLNGKLDKQGNFIADTSSQLVKGRKDAASQAMTIINQLDKRGKLTLSNLHKIIKELYNAEQRKEFAGTIIFFLERKCKTFKRLG